MSTHGTDTRYLTGCRCTECRRAHRSDGARRKAQRWAERIIRGGRAFHPRARHGTVTGYGYYGCRCEACGAAAAAANRRWRTS